MALLAGGFGKRLGQEKAGALAAGRPLLHWTAEALAPLSDDLIVVRRADQRLPPRPPGIAWREVSDQRAETGPLAGIEAALQAARHEVVVAVACDMPLIEPALVRAVAAACADVDVAMPVLDGREQPLLAAYRRSCLPVVEAQLESGEGRPRTILPLLRSRRLGAGGAGAVRRGAGLLHQRQLPGGPGARGGGAAAARRGGRERRGRRLTVNGPARPPRDSADPARWRRRARWRPVPAGSSRSAPRRTR